MCSHYVYLPGEVHFCIIHVWCNGRVGFVYDQSCLSENFYYSLPVNRKCVDFGQNKLPSISTKDDKVRLANRICIQF